MRIHCFTCKKPVTTEIPDDSIIFRGTAQCPECAEKEDYETMSALVDIAFPERIDGDGVDVSEIIRRLHEAIKAQ